MSTHRLRPEALAQTVREHHRQVYRRIPLMVLALGVGLAIPPLSGSTLSPVALGVLGVLGLGAMGLSVRDGLRKAEARLEEHFRTYKLELGEEGLVHRSAVLPEQRLGRGEVTLIEESPGLGLVVWGTRAGASLVLSPNLEGYEEIRARLAGWREVTALTASAVAGRQRRAGVLGIGLSVVFIGLWVGVAWLPDLRLAMACGVVMVVGGVVGLPVLRERVPGLSARPLVIALILFSLSIPVRLAIHFWRP